VSQPTASDPASLAAAAADALTTTLGNGHDVAIVMGSGWAPAADAFGAARGWVAIGDLPGFAAPTAVGHGGEVRSVQAGDRGVLLFLGRTHLYEGRRVEPVVHGVRTAAAAGVHQQPWRFVATQDPELKRRVREAAEEEERRFYHDRDLPEWHAALAPLETDATKEFLQTAPWLVVAFAQKQQNGKKTY
jgi:hypothetical protein